MNLEKAKSIQNDVEDKKKCILRKLNDLSTIRDTLRKFVATPFVIKLYKQYKSKNTILEPVTITEDSSESKTIKQSFPSTNKLVIKGDIMKDKDFIKYLTLASEKSEYKKEIKRALKLLQQYRSCLLSVNKDYKVILESVQSLLAL